MDLLLDIEPDGGARYQLSLQPGEVDVGRSSACGVRLPFPAVSSRHLTLVGDQNGWGVIELGSKNGTLLDGRPLPARQRQALADGARLTIGRVVLTARLAAPTESTYTLTETGAMFRKLLADTVNVGGAFLESASGERIDVPDFAAGLAPPTGRFEIDRRGHGFWVRPVGAATHNGAPLDPSGAALGDGDVLGGDETWTFRDPLQAHLAALDAENVEEPSDGGTRAPRPDRLMMTVGALAVVASIVALLAIFGLL